MVRQSIIDHLSDLRKKLNIKSAKAMAKHIGIAYVTYQGLEKGDIKTIETLDKLVKNAGFIVTHKSMYPDSDAGSVPYDVPQKIIEYHERIMQLEKRVQELENENRILKKDQPLKKAAERK